MESRYPAQGSPAPDIEAECYPAELSPFRLKDYRGQRVILYFYPKDDTPGCTTQACALRDSWASLSPHAKIFGISPDGTASHAKFAAKFDLPFPLISDADHLIAEAYGVWVEKSMYGKKYMGVERSSFIVDADGKIEHILPKVKPAEHVTLLKKALSL